MVDGHERADRNAAAVDAENLARVQAEQLIERLESPSDAMLTAAVEAMIARDSLLLMLGNRMHIRKLARVAVAASVAVARAGVDQ